MLPCRTATFRKKRSHVDLILHEASGATAHGGQLIVDALAKEHGFHQLLGHMDLHHPPCLSTEANAYYYGFGALAFNLLMDHRREPLAAPRCGARYEMVMIGPPKDWNSVWNSAGEFPMLAV